MVSVVTEQPMTALQLEMEIERRGGPLKCELNFHGMQAVQWYPIMNEGYYKWVLRRVRKGSTLVLGVRSKAEGQACRTNNQ